MNSTLQIRLAAATAILFAVYGVCVTWQMCATQIQARRADLALAKALRYETAPSANYVKTLQWLKRAAALGDGAAIYNIGVLYERGQGVPHDYGACDRLCSLFSSLSQNVSRSVGPETFPAAILAFPRRP